MKLATNKPGLFVYADGDGRATIEYRRSGWAWSVTAAGREVASGMERTMANARTMAFGALRAGSNRKEG